MDKRNFQEKKYYSISEVAELIDIKSHTLRFWEKEFKEIKPITRKGNRRYYQKEDLKIITNIKRLLYDEGMTIYGAKKKLNTRNPSSKDSTDLINIIGDLERLLKNL